MDEGVLIDRVNEMIETIVGRRDATRALRDPDLAPLARIAADLRHYPSAEFKAQLRGRLQTKTASLVAVATPRLREGFTSLTPYLAVRDAGLLAFVQSVFGGVETMAAVGSSGGIHREVRIGDSMIMIGEGSAGVSSFRTAAELHIYVDDADVVFRRALAAGATSLGEPADRPYGERSGFVRDPFGNYWFIATHLGASYLPHGLRTVTPFVHAKSTSAYIEFLTRAFGAIEEARHDVGGGSIVYARMRIGDAALELGDVAASAEPMDSAFYLYVGDADRVYDQALAAGARSIWPPTTESYGDRVAAVEDPTGNQWFIARSG